MADFFVKEDQGEIDRFERRFAKTSLGYAFRADDGAVRPLSESEAETARAEGLAAIRHGAFVLQVGTWVTVALVVAVIMFLGGGGKGVFSNAAILGGWSVGAHMLLYLYFRMQVRKATRGLSERLFNRIAMSPTSVGPMTRINYFKHLRGAATLLTVAYLGWVIYSVTGSIDPHQLGDGTFAVNGRTGEVTTTGTGRGPDEEMEAFMKHMPEIGAFIALCWALYLGEWLTDRANDRDQEAMGGRPF